MSFFLSLILGMALLDTAWWVLGVRALRLVGAGSVWRVLFGAFMGVQLVGFVFLLVSRSRLPEVPLAAPIVAELYLWHLLVMPACSIGWLAWRVVEGLRRLWHLSRRPAVPVDATAPADAIVPAEAELGLSRRRLLAMGALAVPPLALATLGAESSLQQDEFLVRQIDVPIAGLPEALEGLRIVHVSDSHVGKFTHGAKLGRIVEAVNDLRGDVVAFTGDLIDFSLSYLDAAMEMVKGFRSPGGTYLCEGNHDLFAGAREFEQRVRSAGLKLLLNEAALLTIRSAKVQILGLRWGGLGTPFDVGLEEHLRQIAFLRAPEAFQVLLAHHPHSFDPARQMGIGLTLSGHTHGGQLMLTRNLGPGPMMFKYWSGLYVRDGSALVVSNGVGNWFPLRVNAPAEIVALNLRRGPAAGAT
jgi:uncharacterized protein